MILCLNLNAAIDKTIVVSSFELNKIHRPESVIALAGGKGCNVARALKTLGEEPVVLQISSRERVRPSWILKIRP
jgi:fructose-1-phosphate kinase PfkB-like protein